MRILAPVQKYNQYENKQNRTTSPSFNAQPKIDNKIFNQVTDGILKELGGSTNSEELAQKIRTQISNPENRKIFFGLVASLVTAAAAHITELITGETCAKDKIKKHRGRQADFEIELNAILNKKVQELNPDEETENAAFELYNKFCGNNYKELHYNSENKIIQNKIITHELISDLSTCNDLNELKNIITKYNESYLTESEYAQTASAKEAQILADIEPDILNTITSYQNIKNSYLAIAKDDKDAKKQDLIKLFIRNVNNNVNDDNIKKMLFFRINKYYSEVLYEIADVYTYLDNNNPEQSQEFLTALTNKMVSTEALKQWESSGCKQRLDFRAYNNLITYNIEEKNIKELAKIQRNTKFSHFNLTGPETFRVKAPFGNYSRNIHLINSIFNILNQGKFEPLVAEDSSNCTIEDIENEIKKRSDSYPNLTEHLVLKNMPYLNKKKMQNLINLYYGNENNHKLFTLHCYLRFLERVVLPDIKKYGQPEDLYSCKSINIGFINKLSELKRALENGFKEPVDVETYQIENIQAPQIVVNLANSEQKYFTITLNNEDKIHTIY